MPQSAEIEEAELRLIQRDATDAIRALRAFSQTPASGVLSLLVLPAAALVAEESYQYFRRRRREHRIGAISGQLFDEFSRSVKKIRARLKLLDDTDTGPDSLAEFLSLVRQQSRTLFSHPSSRLIQFLSSPFRPDLGAYFKGEELVATTHAILPTIGATLEMVRGIQPGQFADFHSFAFDFAKAMGAHFRTLADVLESVGLAVELEPSPQTLDWTITHNDFVGERFYRSAQRSLPCANRSQVPLLTLCLGQVNCALHVLPDVLGKDSNLLGRVQFLTAYHGSNAVRALSGNLPDWLSVDSSDALASSRLRNVFAHYEFMPSHNAPVAADNHLAALVLNLAKVSLPEILKLTHERLRRIGGFLGSSLTKTRLRPARAVLGDHT